MSAGAKAKRLSTSVLRSGIPAGERVDLSVLDVFEYPIPVDLVYIYTTSVDADALRESLCTTLGHYPEFTGRLEGEGRGSGRLYVDSSDQGALFVSARMNISVADKSEAELGELDLRHCLPKHRWLRCKGRDVPLLVIQHTQTACGGMILAIGVLHALADGEVLAALMRDWARVHQGELIETSSMSRVDFQRLFAVREPRDSDPERVPGFKRMSRPMLTWKVIKLGWDSRSTVSVVLPFSNDELQNLQRAAHVEFPKATIGNALLAHVWQAFAQLRPNRDADSTGLFCVVGTRHLRGCQVDQAYTGNAVWHVRAESTYEQVRGAELGVLAEQVQQAQFSLSYEDVCQGMQWLENERAKRNLELGVVPDYELMRRDFFATNIHRLPLYEPDFGAGAPSYVSTRRSPVRWMIRLFPRPGGQGISAHCTVPRSWRRLLSSERVQHVLHRYIEPTS